MLEIKEIFISLIITVIAYMGFPFYKFEIKKEVNDIKVRKKIIFWNSVGFAILFIIMRSMFFGIEYGIKTFAPALLYYLINKLLYCRKKGNTIQDSIIKDDTKIIKENNKEKMITFEEKGKSYTLVYIIIICLTIISSVSICCYTFYKRDYKINTYKQCYDYSKEIYINIGTVDTNTGRIYGNLTIDNNSFNNLEKLKQCLKDASNK